MLMKFPRKNTPEPEADFLTTKIEVESPTDLLALQAELSAAAASASLETDEPMPDAEATEISSSAAAGIPSRARPPPSRITGPSFIEVKGGRQVIDGVDPSQLGSCISHRDFCDICAEYIPNSGDFAVDTYDVDLLISKPTDDQLDNFMPITSSPDLDLTIPSLAFYDSNVHTMKTALYDPRVHAPSLRPWLHPDYADFTPDRF